MNLSDIEIFVEVARSGSITQSARSRRVSQPAISRAIAEFERELDTQLFDRIGRSLYLNAFGEAILPQAQRILISYQNLRLNLTDLSEPRMDSITVGLASESAEWHRSFVSWFLGKYPEANLRVLKVEPSRLLKMLENNECSFGISSSDFLSASVECTRFRTEPIGVLLSINNRLARGDSVSLRALEREPFLLSSRNSDMRRFTTELCARAGFTPNIMLEADLPNTIEELRCIVDGVSFISQEGYQHLLTSGDGGANPAWMKLLAFRPLEEDYCVRHCYLCTPMRRYLSLACRDLIGHIRRSYALPAPL